MKKSASLRTVMGVCISILLMQVTAISQGLLTEKNLSELTLTADETTRLNNHVQSGFTKSTKIVQIGSIAANMQNGIVNFTIPGVSSTYTAETEKFDYTDEGNYGWMASIEDEQGYIAIVAKDYNMVGFIHTTTHYFTLEFLRTGYNVLVEHDLNEYRETPDECATEAGGTPEPDGVCDDSYNTCPAMVHVLVLVTPEASQWFGETFNNPFISALYAWLGFYSVDFAFFNSDIPNKNVRFTVLPFSMTLSSPGNIFTDVNNLSINAQNLREQHEADLVVMLTDTRYGSIFGVVNCIGPDFDCGYSITVAQFMLNPRYTFAHEVGHLFGARHNRPSNGGNDPTDICSHAWRFTDGNNNVQRTILAASPAINPSDPGGRILNYSNPDVLYVNAPTGTPDDDNAKTIRNAGCGVAGYYDSGEMMIGISGPSTACDIEWETFFADVIPANAGTPGQPPYSYQWRWNTTGVFTTSNPGTYLGNGSSVTVGSLACPKFYLWLAVTSSDGVVATTVKRVGTKFCPECQNEQLMVLTSGNFPVANHVGIYPNPATDKTVISFSVEKESLVRYTLSDMQGRVLLRSGNQAFPKGIHTMEPELGGVPRGIYNCTVEVDGELTTHKLVITQ